MSKYITLEVSALSHVIITALNGLQDTHLGHQAGKVKEALIENNITKEENSFQIPISSKLMTEKAEEHFKKFPN